VSRAQVQNAGTYETGGSAQKMPPSSTSFSPKEASGKGVRKGCMWFVSAAESRSRICPRLYIMSPGDSYNNKTFRMPSCLVARLLAPLTFCPLLSFCWSRPATSTSTFTATSTSTSTHLAKRAEPETGLVMNDARHFLVIFSCRSRRADDGRHYPCS